MKKWNELSLKKKILLLFLPVNILSILLILILSISLLVHNSKEEMIKNTSEKLSLVANQTDQIISNITYNVKAFSTDSSLQSAVAASYATDTYGTYLFSSSIHSSIYNIMDIGTLVSNGYIHTFDNKIYNITNGSVDYFPDERLLKRYEDIISQGGKIMIGSPLHQTGISALNISKALIEVQSGRCLGVLDFNIKESLFYDIYGKISNTGSEQFYIIDGNGNIVSAQDRSKLGTSVSPEIRHLISNDLNRTDTAAPYKITNINNLRSLVMTIPLEETDWHVICTVNYSDLFQNAKDLLLLLLIIGSGVLAATILLSGILAKSFVRPIIQLADYAVEVGQGNLETPMPVKAGGEIGFLASRFSEMLLSIKDLTVKIFSEQNQKREYALNLLQAQINPHFLYNCLDNISTLIESNENQTADQMVHHLGRYYKTILSKGRNMITLGEELHLIEDYLKIQLIRDPELFIYKIDISGDIKDYKILKLLLQPIVENSVLHGFTGFPKQGKIEITGYLTEHELTIQIRDNGRGISGDILEQIFIPSDIAVPRHFGLRNINERIRLKYGMAYGITIDSNQKSGTTITVRFPKIP